jgi:high-affinity nickel permease
VIGVGAAASVGFLVGLGFDTAGKKITGKLYDASSNW